MHGLAGDDDQLCDLCKECIDSLEHRNWECVHTVGFRAELIEKFPNRCQSVMRRPNRLFLDLGLVTGSFPVLPTHPEEQETWFPRKARFSGRVYIDGSAQFPAEPFFFLRRCGYSVVSLDDRFDWSVDHPAAFGLAACVVYGPLKRHLHTVPASETMALLCALRNADPPLQVGYDCKVVGDTGAEERPEGRLGRPKGKSESNARQARGKGNESLYNMAVSHLQVLSDYTAGSDQEQSANMSGCGRGRAQWWLCKRLWKVHCRVTRFSRTRRKETASQTEQ